MKKRLMAATSVAASALLLGLFSATPASAATLRGQCSTTGAWGGITVNNFNGATDRIDFSMTISDTSADGHHARIRLKTKNHVGTVKNWSWHANYGGEGHDERVVTYAHDDSGIFSVGIQVARFEGSTLLNSCTEWTTAS
ncbi:hypothetical protein [Streptomyces sp. HC307]|uniref:hypothetical protein n=1 Tax=Streptomyces flavusporus TaxID=3385496 RepID=UPI0039174ECE